MTKLIVDLDESNLRELLEICHQRTRDGIECPVRLAIPCEINIGTTIRKLEFAVACKTVVYHRQPLIPFHITGTLEEFIEHRIDSILRRGDQACHCDLIGELTGDQPFIVREVNLDS